MFEHDSQMNREELVTNRNDISSSLIEKMLESEAPNSQRSIPEDIEGQNFAFEISSRKKRSVVENQELGSFGVSEISK